MAYDIRPISTSEWLPDRCLRLRGPLDPATTEPQGGCERLKGFFTGGQRDKLVALYEDCLLRHGCCGFVAWDGAQVVGYNTFFPKDWSPTRPVPTGERRQPGALHHHCISVVESEQVGEETIAEQLIQRTLGWARENGWERFEVQAVLPASLACRRVLQVYDRAFWEKMGLRATDEIEPERRFEVIRGVAAIDGVTLASEQDADKYYPDWRRDAVHYTMAIDLTQAPVR